MDKRNYKICAVLVTFNRQDLLLKVLSSFKNQTIQISGIVLVNNCSTDNTEEKLIENSIIDKNSTSFDTLYESKWNDYSFYYYKSSQNTGGSGGFAQAFSIAEELDYDYIWAMDDDVYPDPNCLETLLKFQDDKCAVTIPNRDGNGWKEKYIVDYNLTNPFLHRINDYKSLGYASDLKEKYVKVVDMPMEGPLIKMDIAKKIGIPNKDYFIMYDDTDFAHRLSQETEIRFVRDAKLKRLLVIPEEKRDWTWKTYYLTRNSMIFDKKYGKNIFVKKFRPFFYYITKLIGAKRDHNQIRYNIAKRAYQDFKNNKMGITVKPGTPPENIN